jgi:hypothetical protein
MSIEFVVRARRSSEKAHEAGIFATFELDLKDGETVLATLSDGVLRKSTTGYWVSPPAKKVGEKWYRNWRIYPGADDANRQKIDQWVVGEILKQIPNPDVAAEKLPETNRAPQVASTAHFAPKAGYAKAPAPTTPAAAGNPMVDQAAASSFPFPPS